MNPTFYYGYDLRHWGLAVDLFTGNGKLIFSIHLGPFWVEAEWSREQ